MRHAMVEHRASARDFDGVGGVAAVAQVSAGGGVGRRAWCCTSRAR